MRCVGLRETLLASSVFGAAGLDVRSPADPDSKIADPYAWLEEQSDETEAFVQAQQAFTEAYLAKDEDNRAIYRETLRDLFNYARFSAPSLKGDG